MTVFGTGISWTNSTWNPWVGCVPVSAGCDHCYAAALVNGPRGAIFGHPFHEVRLHLNRLAQVSRFKPLVGADGKRRPHMVFVNSMSDFFLEQVPDSAIHQVLDVLEQHRGVVFQLLSKRPIRARKMLVDRYGGKGIPGHMWFGFTVETNQVAKRLEILRSIKERVGEMSTFVSVEPIVGPTDQLNFEGVDWVITGGESGPGARMMDADWVRAAIGNAIMSGAAVWHKQNGSLKSHPNLVDVPAIYRRTQRQTMEWLVETGRELLPEEKGGATVDRKTHRELPPVYHAMTR